MNNLLSTVSGYFSRSLILGAFLPVIIFIASLALLAFPLFPEDFSPFVQLVSLETEWKVISVTFVTIVLSGLIYNLNNSLVRVYEGYPWKNTSPGRWMIRRKIKQFCRLKAQEKGMRTLLIAMADADEKLKKETLEKINKWKLKAPRSIKNNLFRSAENSCQPSAQWDALDSAINSGWSNLSLRVINDFPPSESQILPTRLGNVIRSFENYANREYCIDAITLYPRLVAKIDKDYASVIDDAKTSFDFMINSSLLSLIAAVILAAAGFIYSRPFNGRRSLALWITEIVFFLFLSVIAYLGAVNQSRAWGETIKSAFDLYRNQLLEQLGYAAKPDSRAEERSLWDEISAQMLYGNPRSGPKLIYRQPAPPTPAATRATGAPEDMPLSVLKSFDYSGKNSCLVTVEVSNDGEAEKAVEDVILTDTVPAGWFYRTDSARLYEAGKSGSKTSFLSVVGANPYSFHLGSFGSLQKKRITYEILLLRGNDFGKGGIKTMRITFDEIQNLIIRSLVKTTGSPAPLEGSTSLADAGINSRSAQAEFEYFLTSYAAEAVRRSGALESREQIYLDRLENELFEKLEIDRNESLNELAEKLTLVIASILPGDANKERDPKR